MPLRFFCTKNILKLVISHPTGNANVRAIVMSLYRAGMLEKFFTTIACFENSEKLRRFLIKDLNRREFDEKLRPFTEPYPWREAGRHVFNKLGLSYFTNKESSAFGINTVYKSLDRYLARKLDAFPSIKAVYGYEDGSYYTFRSAKERGLHCVYELPIAYWDTARTLLAEEAERWPGWKPTLKGGIADSKEKLQRKTIELELSDIVITPSRFVAASLPGWAMQKRIIISPFGTPGFSNYYKRNHDRSIKKPLRILFAGSMSQRKGLADLFEAIGLLNTNHIQLIVLGSLLAPLQFYKKACPSFQYEQPRVHAEVLELMETCDVLCLPSIVEGRALVMQEAMSRGLPIIVTPNTGGEDLIREGETGFLVPIRSPEAIAEKINWFLENRSLLDGMREAAFIHASDYTWDKYCQTILEAFKD